MSIYEKNHEKQAINTGLWLNIIEIMDIFCIFS